MALYYYDGNGTKVKSMIGGVVTYYGSPAYQVKTDGTNENTRKYYAFGSSTIAMRENGVLTWLMNDQINSTTVTAAEDGTPGSEIRYTAFGETRWVNGVTVTDNKYTGQREEVEIGLYFYVARWYDPVLAHFTQADTLVPEPGNTLAYLHYAYVSYNPIRYSDPSGHKGYGQEGQSGNWSLGVTTIITKSQTNGGNQYTFTTTDSKSGKLISTETHKVGNGIEIESLIESNNQVQQVTITASPEEIYTIGPAYETIQTDWCVVSDTDWVTVTVDLVGIAGDASLAFGPPGWLAWGGSEIIEGVGLGWALLKPEPDHSSAYWWYIGKFLPGIGSMVDAFEIYGEIISCEIYKSIPVQQLQE